MYICTDRTNSYIIVKLNECKEKLHLSLSLSLSLYRPLHSSCCYLIVYYLLYSSLARDVNERK